MTAEEWKLQVSYTIPNGPMINIRAQTSDELSVLLEGVGDYSTQVAAVQSLIKAAFITAPLATTATTVDTPPWETSPTVQPVAQSGTGLSSPTCVHGARRFMSGISKKNGKPYSMWVCPQPQGADQCSPVNG